MANLQITIEVYRGSTLIKRDSFDAPSVTIGSASHAMLQVSDPSVAELHCVTNAESSESVTLLDLGSVAGTSRGGQRVQSASLRHGDTFEVGDLTFRVLLDDEEAYEEEATSVSPPAPVAAQRAAPVAARPQAAAAEFSDDDPTDEGEAENASFDNETEDVIAFVTRSGTSRSEVGLNKKRPKVLEVNQLWNNTLVDTQHFSHLGQDVTIGARIGWKWHFLGVDMGWIPAPLHLVLPYTPPMWSEVSSHWRNEFYTPNENLTGGAEHQLFRHVDEHYVAHVEKTWDGFVDIGDDRLSFDDLVRQGKAKLAGTTYEIPMTDDLRLMVDIGGTMFYAHKVFAGQRIVDRNSEDIDYPFLAIFSLFISIGVLFALVMAFTEKPPQTELNDLPDRFVEMMLEKPPEEEKKDKKPDANPDAGEGAKAKRDEGKVGKKDATMEKAKGNKVEVKKSEQDRQIAENAGLLGALADAGELDGVFGSSALDASLAGGVGGLLGAKGTQIGAGGLGSRGSGLGGGGSADGLGGLGTKGIGSGKSGYGSGGGSFGAKGEGGLGSVGGDPIVLGALDRSLIDEVVKRHMNQIRYCYQRELTKNPSLGGKIVVKFTIAKDGTVSKASTASTTMSNKAVEGCIEGRFMRMQFPQPKGGGIVIVSYPFIFAPG